VAGPPSSFGQQRPSGVVPFYSNDLSNDRHMSRGLNAAAKRNEPHRDLRIDTGNGPKPATLEQWNTSWARACVLAKRRLVSELHSQVSAGSKPIMANRGQHGRESRRRSVRSNPRRSRAPGSNSDDGSPHLEVIDPAEFSAFVDSWLSPAPSGLFCVPSHAQRLSAESSSPELGGARGEEVAGR
jgi:hypothetical protein